MKTNRLKWAALVLALFLAGCKVELYSGLPESEANQMLALLMLKKIPAEKQVEKGGKITLQVDKAQFINAVEVLRQSGFPKRTPVGMSDVFPTNQLVSSPAQERAKMVFLKEQQLEGMLTSMDGVITANVSIAQRTNENGQQVGSPSAAVFIKYSPEFNLVNNETQIKSLVRDSVPDIGSDQISVVMQPATYRYVAAQPESAQAVPRWRQWINSNPSLALAGAVSGVLFLLSGAGALAWSFRRR